MKTASDFAISTRVQHKSDVAKRGVVVGNKLSGGDQEVAVEYDDGSLAKVNVNDLQICLTLEEEFQILQNQVNGKLDQAAALIVEASKMASNGGSNLHKKDDDYENVFNISSVEYAMGRAGWNTSSWYC